MNIKSPVFQNNNFIPKKYTCDGDNVNPPLEITGIPENTKSLSLIIDDPDSSGGSWTHWLVWNINPETTEFRENNVPTMAVEGLTSFDKFNYGGPCPHSGTHRYLFKLYALDIVLTLPRRTDKIALEKAMAGHVVDEAELIGLYSRL